MTLAAIAEDSGPRLITQAELLANASDVDGPALSAINLADQPRAAARWSTTATAPGPITPALNDGTSVTFSYTVTRRGRGPGRRPRPA